jgi:transposase
MHMTSLFKSSLNGLSGSSGETVAEGARRATGETVSPEAARRDPEVVAIARRRKFSGSEKRRLLAEAERCKQAGTLGAFLRREGIYSSMIAIWRKKVGRADQAALAPKKRGPKPDGSARQIQKLERDNARLCRKLERAELIIDAQKKLCVALGLPTADDTSGDA